ncbi:MAG: hypothetical protein C4582_09235 [Desulfobacteraceae bacterium]|jgi:hypothetical protein|nr:MAG: hypothetical protein C4582_09235 [Desulfobacteraceae bacterium]
MPGFDGRGPMGAGPMTGGGRGFCKPARNSAALGGGFRGVGRDGGIGIGFGFRRVWGFGFGRGGGYGRGFVPAAFYPARGNQYYAPSPQDEVSSLRKEAEFLKQDLDAINNRISELETKSAQS